MRLLILFNLIAFFVLGQTEVPYRPDTDFDIKIEYDFKKKPVPSPQETNYVLIQERNNVALLPHLTIYFSLVNKTEEEQRLRVTDNLFKVMHSGKIKEDPVKLVLGYMVDIKERVSAHKFTITILSKKRDPINQVVLEIAEDGTYYVNESESGKF